MDLFNINDSKEVQELEKDIPMYAKAYYEGRAIISDMEFDQLVDRLRELKPDSTILHTPGWGYKQTGAKARHKYQIVKSLDKCRTIYEIPDRFLNKKVALSPKLDGLTGVFYYKEGKLIQAITRGNGQEGKDITDKALLIEGAEIKDKHFTGAVRGELEISKANWEKIKGKYPDAKNARNLCAGWINSKEYDVDEIQLIDFVTYKVVGQEREEGRKDYFYNGLVTDKGTFTCLDYNPSKFSIIDWLYLNFKHSIPKLEIERIPQVDTIEFMQKVFDKFMELGYELDGVVISDMETRYIDDAQSYLYDEVAFKFQSETTETTVESITWELSRTQRYVPVLNVTPVFLSGAEIRNVTGNNAKYVLENGLGVGAKFEITRSGEVIPKHLKTIDMVDPELPEICPVCGHKLEWVGVDLKCINPDCNNIYTSDLQQWCEVIGETDGMAWTLMEQYLNLYGIKDIESLYNKQDYVYRDMQSRPLSITDNKALQFFDKLYKGTVEADKLLMALNIPRLGDKTAKLMSRNPITRKIIGEVFACLDGLKPVTLSDETQRQLLELVKDATTNEIMNNLYRLSYCKYKRNLIIFNDTSNKEIIKVAVTGALETMKRSAFEKYIESYGYELSSSIKSCRYLITNNPNSGSSKNKDAQKYGVEIITEKDFLDLLGGNKQSNSLF